VIDELAIPDYRGARVFMAEAGSKRDGDSQSDKPVKKETATDQSVENDEDVSSKPPSRVHIFKHKPGPDDSSKSVGRRLQFSSFRMNRPFVLPYRPFRPAMFSAVLPHPLISLTGEIARLRFRIEKGKKALYEAAMKAEDLEAIVQGLKRTRDSISKKR
jgi:hypothetical protein